ncbi:MAG: TonB family protein [Ignavibacteriales bacterium]
MRTVAFVAAVAWATSAPAGAFNYDAVYTIVPRPSIITNPERLAAPDEASAARAYPIQARKARVNGAARITCDVAADQRLTGCAVSWESPLGYGFGDAALSLAPLFRFAPATRDGRAITGWPVSQVVSFDLFPKSARPPAAPPPPWPPATHADRGSQISAPAELQQIQLMDERLAAVERYSDGYVRFVGLDDQKRDGSIVETNLTDVFSYPGESLPVFRVERVRADCSEQTISELGQRFFDYRGQPDGWRLSDDKAPQPATSNDRLRPLLRTICSGPQDDVIVPSIDAAIVLVRNWPAATK